MSFVQYVGIFVEGHLSIELPTLLVSNQGNIVTLHAKVKNINKHFHHMSQIVLEVWLLSYMLYIESSTPTYPWLQ